jgi:Arc/MetJ family transcription regulator
MGAHMKTTIEISDALLNEAKRVAEKRGTTLRQLVEEGLRRTIRDDASGRAFKLRKASFRGRGLQVPLSEGQWDRIRELAYEDRGA